MHGRMKPFLIINQNNRIKYEGAQWNYNTNHKEKINKKQKKSIKSQIIYF